VPAPDVRTLRQAPQIARRARGDIPPGPPPRVGLAPVPARRPAPVVQAVPERAEPKTPVSDMCGRNRHGRCIGKVRIPGKVNGRRYVPCGCTVPNCGHGPPPST
jgi:hypothetical protein